MAIPLDVILFLVIYYCRIPLYLGNGGSCMAINPILHEVFISNRILISATACVIRDCLLRVYSTHLR